MPNLVFTNTPVLFGPFHIVMLLLVTTAALLLYKLVRIRNEDHLLQLLHRLGLIMILAEIWKQWFVLRYVYPDFSLWFFPWQLCSMAMYCSFFVTFVKEKYQNVLLVFLSSFSFFSAIVALVVPSDMLRPQIPLAVHGFIYHGIIIAESLIAIRILRQRSMHYQSSSVDSASSHQATTSTGERIRFAPAALLFLIMSGIAEIINCIGHYLLPGHWPEPDMFYITPFYPSTQPVCAYVAEKLGILPEILIYSAAIILISYLFYLVANCLHKISL